MLLGPTLPLLACTLLALPLLLVQAFLLSPLTFLPVELLLAPLLLLLPLAFLLVALAFPLLLLSSLPWLALPVEDVSSVCLLSGPSRPALVTQTDDECHGS